MNNLPRVYAQVCEIYDGQSKDVPYESQPIDVTDIVLNKTAAELKRLDKNNLLFSASWRREFELATGINIKDKAVYLIGLYGFLREHDAAGLLVLDNKKWKEIQNKYDNWDGEEPRRTQVINLTISVEYNLNHTPFKDMEEHLRGVACRMFDEGLITGETNTSIVAHSINCKRVPRGKVYIGEEIDQL